MLFVFMLSNLNVKKLNINEFNSYLNYKNKYHSVFIKVFNELSI